jgi:tetratricopeptide (TPR) repeat protein
VSRAAIAYAVAIPVLLSSAVMLQVWRDRGWQPYEPQTPVLWLQNASLMRRVALGFDNVIADVYWMRAVVYFGRQRLSQDVNKNYDLLYPYLDFVTTLDPRFQTAYRFGAVFLSEARPGGPARPDLAVKLLQRGMEHTPERWEYPHDIGFVYYWSERDYPEAAKWFERASTIPGAPFWLKSTAAATLVRGGDRASARQIWRQMYDNADQEWLKNTAEIHLAQFDALDAIDTLDQLVVRYKLRTGRAPQGWEDLVRAGVLRAVPRDPAGVPFEIDPATETVKLARQSPLWPLPEGYEKAGR